MESESHSGRAEKPEDQTFDDSKPCIFIHSEKRPLIYSAIDQTTCMERSDISSCAHPPSNSNFGVDSRRYRPFLRPITALVSVHRLPQVHVPHNPLPFSRGDASPRVPLLCEHRGHPEESQVPSQSAAAGPSRLSHSSRPHHPVGQAFPGWLLCWLRLLVSSLRLLQASAEGHHMSDFAVVAAGGAYENPEELRSPNGSAWTLYGRLEEYQG